MIYSFLKSILSAKRVSTYLLVPSAVGKIDLDAISNH
jgi:hypothetical protein